jgi:hypothetical protein
VAFVIISVFSNGVRGVFGLTQSARRAVPAVPGVAMTRGDP